MNITWRYGVEESVTLSVSYGIVFILGFIGNTLVIVAVCRGKAMKQNTTYIFIANLAVADLFVTVFCIPFTLLGNLLLDWSFGNVICKALAYVQAVSINASALSLIAISVDRCLTINDPFIPGLSTRKLRRWIACIWLFSGSIMSPWLIVFKVRALHKGESVLICTDQWENKTLADSYFVTVNLLLSYLIPLLIISICYTTIFLKITHRNIPGELCAIQRRSLYFRSKIQIIKMVLFIIVTFAISWAPIYIIFLLLKFSDFPYTEKQEYVLHKMFPVAQWLATANSCTNPIIYTCFSKRFKTEFEFLLKPKCFKESNERPSIELYPM